MQFSPLPLASRLWGPNTPSSTLFWSGLSLRDTHRPTESWRMCRERSYGEAQRGNPPARQQAAVNDSQFNDTEPNINAMYNLNV
jgi:hypothetical protein